MFDTLLVSPATNAPWTRSVTVALIFHILLIAAAVSRTASSPTEVRPVSRDTIRLELAEVLSSPLKNADAFAPEPIVPGPPGIPDIDLSNPEFEVPSFGYRGPGGPLSKPGYFPPPWAESGRAADTTRLVSGSTEVDELPELIAQPYPRYPDGLRSAGVSGVVQLQFVVGTDGRVDERTIHVVVSSHPGFMLAAFRALRESRFRPARRNGRPAAALVEQTIRFSYR